MSCRAVPFPNTANPPFYHASKQSAPSSAKNQPFAAPNQRTLRFPTLHSASSFRARAAVEGGEFVGEIGGGTSFYELLGISEQGSFDEIKKAYKKLARKYHPDVSPPDRTEEYTRRFIEVQEAYETLSDPRLRAVYDRDLARGLHLAFSARSRRRFDEELEVKSQWKSRWQQQMAELKRRSMHKDSDGNQSWGARMRGQRAAASSD